METPAPEGHQSGSDTPEEYVELPEHHGECYGCGTARVGGLRARRFLHGDQIVVRFTPQPHHAGGLGMAHGGVIAALFDEALGSVPPLILDLMCATGTLSVTYRAPAPIGQELEVRAHTVDVTGRKVLLRGEARVGELLVAEAEATYITMDWAHFAAGDPNSTAIRK